MIAVVDYQKGNLKSVERGLLAVGAREVVVTAKAEDIARASTIVLPGVGAFADAAETMTQLGQMDVVRKRVLAGVPFLGICLGMHLMFEEGTEGATAAGNARGLGILPGVVDVMPRTDAEGNAYKVPHVGWNSIFPFALTGQVAGGFGSIQSLKQSSLGGTTPEGCFVRCGTRFVSTAEPSLSVGGNAFSSPLLDGIKPGEFFYFTHSYVAPETAATVAVAQHSVVVPSVVQWGEACFGVQFHPEKSSDAGMRMLRNFVRIAKED